MVEEGTVVGCPSGVVVTGVAFVVIWGVTGGTTGGIFVEEPVLERSSF